MGKPTGFMEYRREQPDSRPPRERVADWQEFHRPLTEEILRRQGARCMDCGTPFCHTGIMLNGMVSGCPLHNLIPEWNDLVYRGHWHEALERLHRTNNFPEFTGCVCPAPCEGSCVVGVNEPPVSIKCIEQAISQRGWDEGWIVPLPPARPSGKEVAVIGSGPAGLSAAAELNRAGHRVTVFERDDRPGGLLMYGIPNMKLDKEQVLLRRIGQLAAEGVQFVLQTEVGGALAPDTLLARFDALVLAVGARRPRDLPVAGRMLEGVHFALDYLSAATRSLLDRQPPEITARDRDVVVVGGGDTGTDCVATALRQGCRSVRQLEIMPRPPAARLPGNPWPEWPRIYGQEYGQQEAVQLLGEDPRQYQWTALEFEGDGGGRVQGVRAAPVNWQLNRQGKPVPEPIPGEETVIPAQLVLLALGFLGPEQGALQALGVELTPGGTVQAEEYRTCVPAIFAAGDCRRGQSLVVWAIREGRGAAAACHRYLEEQKGPGAGAADEGAAVPGPAVP